LATPEEALVASLQNILDMMMDGNFDQDMLPKHIIAKGNQVRPHHNALRKIYYYPPLIMLLLDLHRFSGHFRKTDLFRTKPLVRLIDTQCGVGDIPFVAKYWRLTLCQRLW
jgi:hypothetical protein